MPVGMLSAGDVVVADPVEVLDQRPQRVAVRGDQHGLAGAQVGHDRGRPSTAASGATTSLRHSVRGQVVAEVGVARVAGLGELVVVVDRRRRRVVGAAPEHELLLAVLLERLLLVLALQRAVVALVEPPGALHRDPVPVRGVEREVRRCGWPGAAARCARRRAARPTRAAAGRRGRPRASPFSVRSTSTQPVNRFLAFHSLSPWRSRTRV